MRRFGVMLPLTTIFTARTIRELARQIEALSSRPVLDSVRYRLPAAMICCHCPLRRDGCGSCTNWNRTILCTGCRWHWHLRGPLDKMALQAALQGLLNWHQVLRTAFVDHDGRPNQVILDDLESVRRSYFTLLPESDVSLPCSSKRRRKPERRLPISALLPFCAPTC